MKQHRALWWSAYIDGEMTVSEIADFLESLCEDDRRRLDAELRFERSLSALLAAKTECPDAAWSAARQRIAAEESKPERRYPLLFQHAWKFAAVAVAVFLVVFLLQLPHQAEIPDFLRAAPSVEALTATTQVSDDLDSVRDFLKDNNVKIWLKPLSSIELPAGHATALRGARSTFYRGTKITELLYECCGQPLKIVFTENSAAARKMIETASRCGEVQAWREIGAYYAVLVGSHEARILLDLLEDGKGVVG